MDSIRKIIVDSINSIDANDAVIILKGFNDLLSEIKGDFLFSKEVKVDGIKESPKEFLETITNNHKTCFMIYEDLLTLSELQLGGVFTASGREVILLDNNYYENYYPSGFDLKDYDKLKKQQDKDTDSFIQKLYGEIEQQNGNVYTAYNDPPISINNLGIHNKKITDILIRQAINDNNETVAIIPDECDLISLSDAVSNIINNGIGKVSILDDSISHNLQIASLKKNLEKSGVKIITRSFKVNEQKVAEEFYNDYLDILHRKNSEYDFRSLKVYENPYATNELADLNQSVIIDDIVQNAIKAYNKEPFRDVFVTAPTGAGKSVMFQIPAIYLAEKYNLVTLVISPLIGLMNDQVQNIKSMTDLAATINSDYTPMQKEATLSDIKNGDKSILYLSPEALLSNTDISSLIGEREIGLIVVDEAHIVATWGKSFRPDYWYLGDFINKLRNSARSNYKFPIATFTATATFGGDDNMYHDIIESLKMTPNKYIGNVRRDDIGFRIDCQKADMAYREEKIEKAVDSINKLSDTGEKTLVYVPYTKHVDDIMKRLNNPERAGRYFGGLSSGEKNETLESISNGTKNVVVATKAFGMGIDIDDIKYVYHFAPTGNVADYVQEIGRAARKPNMDGVAMTDFYTEDFRYINQLYGMSSIRNFQIIAVLRKILQLYNMYKKRNFLVAPDEFSFIFADSRPEDIDSKIKTTLLMIRKDFESDNNSNYPPVIFKPRSMFTLGYFVVNDAMLKGLSEFGYLKYFKKLNIPRTYEQPSTRYGDSDVKVSMSGDVYQLDYKGLWENNYRDMSFSMFKHCFFENKLENFNFKIGEEIYSTVILRMDAGNKSLNSVRDDLCRFLDSMIDILSDLKQNNKYFDHKDLASLMIRKGCVKKKYIAEIVASSFIQMIEKIDPYRNTIVKRPFSRYNQQTNKYIIETVSYENRIKRLQYYAGKFVFGDRHSLIRCTSLSDDISIIILQLVELLELAFCSTTAGEKPEFFIRVNNAYAIEKVINNPDYVSRSVANVGKKHGEACVLMRHFFTEMSSDISRWDFIERYFLGQIDKSEIEEMKKKTRQKENRRAFRQNE